ncbi:hypothetical protein N7516_011393 [Penicillium verrucosum]|uniref:uncharacterized protein n=1 Tax=Penicillium verrucosum TaxID=60171 RepID=UPI002545A899|nr:uncharacterized protein N7516_011393 [Penicillium verrucosum]KAJ5920535.1 hypothetical protein N7516_011393 [Penicillium verrucosum]
MTALCLYTLFLLLLVPVCCGLPINPRAKSEDSFSVELLQIVADKGAVLGLSVGGAVLLVLLTKEAGAFFFWWARYAIERKDDSVPVELLRIAAEKGPLLALELGGAVLLYLLLREIGMFLFWWARHAIERLPINPRAKSKDSFSVELLEVVADKGTVLGLSLGGAVLLILLAKEVGVFFFWWARYAIRRRDGNQRRAGAGGGSGG